MSCFVTGPVRSISSIFAPVFHRVSSVQDPEPSYSRCRFRGREANLLARNLYRFIFSSIRPCQRKIGEETSSGFQSGRFLTAKSSMLLTAICIGQEYKQDFASPFKEGKEIEEKANNMKNCSLKML